MESFSDSSVYRVPGCRREKKKKKNLYTAVLIYRSALNGSVPGAEENLLWILVSISNHWICPGPGEIPDGEPWQPAVPAVGILHPPELPQPCPAPTGGAHWRYVGSSSFTVHPALKSHPHSDAMLPREGLTAPTCFPRRARVAPPGALGYSTQALLVLVFQQAACPGEWESNRTSSFPVPPRCPRNTELGHKQLAKAGRATSTCHQKQGPTQGTGEPGKRCAGWGGAAIARHAGPRGAHAKAKRSARGATQTAGSLPPTARHHHAPQRMSCWAEA